MKSGDESEAEAEAAISELIADYGLACVIQAVLKSDLADSLSHHGSSDAALRVTQYILRRIAYADNARLQAEIMALGCGLILCDEAGCRYYARKHGLSPAAISKRVIEYADDNGFPPSQFMRSLKDRATYAKTNRPRTK